MKTLCGRTSPAIVVIASVCLGAVACHRGLGREAISHKDDYRQTYIYSFPMIAAYKAMYDFNIDKTGPQYKGPFNQIVNEARVFTYRDTAIVFPNSDTPYSMVQMDLRAEPIVSCVPKMEKSRFFNVQLTDLYTFNYGYIGSRTTGNDGGCYLIAGPGWTGETPGSIKKVFRSETQFSLAIFRTQLFSPADMVNVKRVQAGYEARPLSAFLHQAAPPSAPPINFPKFTDNAFKADFPFFLNFLLQFCPEVAEDKDVRAKLTTIGIGSGQEYVFDRLSDVQKAELGLGVKEGYAAIEKRRDEIGKKVNGWQVGAAFGDRAFYHGDFLLRAAAILVGIYGNDAEEATYPFTTLDGDGERLDGGKHKYALTFPAEQLPPVNSFWSLTMYDGNTQLLIDNPINRYLINSPVLPSMKKNADGSLTIYIQKDAPAADKIANWLPAPDGPIYLMLRLYWPKTEPPSILPAGEGTWKPPAVAIADR